MNEKKVTIGVVLYKGEKYLKQSLTSLVNQDYPNIEFLLRDQSPNGEAFEYIKNELPEVFQKIKIEKGENRWHSGGHNTLIRQMSGEYYFCCSNDMLYPTDFVSNMVSELEKPENQKYGSATCKLLFWDFENNEGTNLIDSCGLGIKFNHHFYDVGQGERDAGQYDDQRDIFGASGALAIYRKTALEAIACTNKKDQKEYFDELLHYKNDIDLSYRLQWAGYPCLFIPDVKVYHDRQISNKTKSPSLFVRILKARKGKSRWVRENSFFGHQVVLIKNFSPKFSKKTRLKTNWQQWMTIGYISLFETYLLKQFRELKQNEQEIDRKCEAMTRKASPDQIEKLMN